MSTLSLLIATGLAFPFASAQVRTASITDAPPPRQQLTPMERGDIFMARKEYRDAIETYREIPESAVVDNKIGIAYHQLGDLGLALKSYQRAIKLDKKYAEAVNNLGTIYYSRKSYRRAIREYERALRISPESASIWANLASAYEARNDLTHAEEAMQRALMIDPNVFERHSSVGSLVQERSVEDRAKHEYLWAKSYAKAGRNDLAIQYIRKALEDGFKDRNKFKQEPEFAGLRDDPEFQQLMATEQKIL